MALAYVPDSFPESQSQYFEATQLSQPRISDTQQTHGTWQDSQVEPRRKYWATFIPINPTHSILKIPWSLPRMQVGRAPARYNGVRNDVVILEKRISNVHCTITLGNPSASGFQESQLAVLARDSDNEPEVWVKDLGSSNGTYVNGTKITHPTLLQHGDELSLGHQSTMEDHDVRYIFRSVGGKGQTVGEEKQVGEVYERYQFLGTLGKGTFAEVKKAVDVETGAMRAMKMIVKHKWTGNKKTLNLFKREIEILLLLQHENICRMIEYYEDPQHICLVLEYIEGGDMLDYIMNYPATDRGLPEEEAAHYALQICRAMAYMHEKGIAHRDLKPENILVTKETTDCPRMVKIADFGLAKIVDDQTMLVSMVGTPQYLAPEVVMQSKEAPGYENVVDSWSVGIIVYSMMTKALPFDEDNELSVEKRIMSRFYQKFDAGLLDRLGVSLLAIDFIDRLLAKDPRERMTMAEALEHEWLAGPSSQITESQAPQMLGGDSMWAINSFDDESSFGNDFDGQDREWTRPVTASVTGPDLLKNASEEDFSQPMGNLKLDTPGPGYRVPTAQTPRNGSMSAPSLSLQPPLQASLPVQIASPPSPPLTNPNASPLPAPSSLKRKQPLKTLDYFSSGSLSPPPSGDETTMQTAKQSKCSPSSSPKAKQKATKTAEAPTRSSARLNTRPRKSARLA
ncbi:ser/thr/tyr protein kinase RAD53, partial [Tremellales sp. Uapishka_1]